MLILCSSENVLEVDFGSDLAGYLTQLLGILAFGVLLSAGALLNESSIVVKCSLLRNGLGFGFFLHPFPLVILLVWVSWV